MAMSGSVKGFSTDTMRSFRKAAANINKAAKQFGADFGPALRAIGEEIMTDVKDSRPGHGVPVKDGHLRSSGTVKGPTGDVKTPEVSLTFGGAAAPYALMQHEVLRFRHKVGEARYLVRGLERWKATGSRAYKYFQNKMKKNLNQEP